VAKTDKARVGELDEHRQVRLKAGDEGVELIQRMHADLQVLAEFLAEERSTASRRGLSSKRLARLRLMADDLGSATGFATKAIKG
jgi:hypothetical protein